MAPELDEMTQRCAVSGSDSAKEIEELGFDLGRLQRQARACGLPVLVLFEGWEAAGKGTLINRLAMALDPRGYRVISIESSTEQERLRPPLYRFWRDLPEPGQFILYDRSWYDRVWGSLAEGELGKTKLQQACEDIRAFERTLVEQGYLIVKFFLNITKKEQAGRFKLLQRDKSTSWRIDASDHRQHRRFTRWRRAIEKVMAKTGDAGSFFVVDAGRRQDATLLAFRELKRVLSLQLDASVREENALGADLAASAPPNTTNASPGSPSDESIRHGDVARHSEMAVFGAAYAENTDDARAAATSPNLGTRITTGPDRLSSVDLVQTLDQSQYGEQLDELKDRLRQLEHRIYKKRIGVVIGFEGWDAAGKGGCIRRLVSALDPRGYEVIPISAPTAHEASMHYLWRFAHRLPKGGHIAIFDRTWYGRVLVERVEGFAPDAKWRVAYEEIRAFEAHLVRSGNVLVKFWLHIDAEEQLRRFQAREHTPEKRWKITEEDWRNREKRSLYEAAVADMIELTSAPECPWTIVAANNKPIARITAMRTVASAIAKRLDA